MRPRLVILLAVLLSLVSTPLYAQRWSEQYYAQFNVSVQFPAEPTVSQTTYPAGVSTVPATVYAWQQETATFSLTVADFAGRASDQRAAVDRAIAAAHGNGDVKLDVFECISGQPGRELSIAGKDGSALKVSVFAVGSRLYLLEAKLTPPNVLRDSGDAARFQQSLSFGDPTTASRINSGSSIGIQPACRGLAAPASRVNP
ncbi:MAG: hypothetical protein JO128_12950 [Alphaproteobacteria bacterium]|nr:hypothetical protein [Alphaproteobacteria bacterium]